MGRAVVEELTARVPADQIVAGARTPDKAPDLGVAVRELDYDRRETLTAALEGATKVLLISGNEFGSRVRQHAAVVDAAKLAGATVLYTSASKADTVAARMVAEHKATEEYIKTSGAAYTILRNNFYHESQQATILQAVEQGAIYGCVDGGRTASAARRDFAAGAAAVLAADCHDGKTYELSGDTAWTYADLAAEISAVTGNDVIYHDLPTSDYVSRRIDAGLPAAVAEIMADTQISIANGWLADTPGTLGELIGRPTQPIADYIRTLLQGH